MSISEVEIKDRITHLRETEQHLKMELLLLQAAIHELERLGFPPEGAKPACMIDWAQVKAGEPEQGNCHGCGRFCSADLLGVAIDPATGDHLRLCLNCMCSGCGKHPFQPAAEGYARPFCGKCEEWKEFKPCDKCSKKPPGQVLCNKCKLRQGDVERYHESMKGRM